jgi:arylsulfatase A-like enzyme
MFPETTVWKAGAGESAHSGEFRGIYERHMGRLDRSLSDLLRWVRRAPYASKTNILVISVGGMELFDHGRLGPATGYYEESVRFPLIWVGPSVPPGLRLDARVSLLDLFPTLAKMYNLSDDVKKFEGLDISSSFRNIFPADRRFLLEGTRAASPGRAVVFEGHKLILHSDGRAELYDLQADPGERNDLVCSKPELTATLKGLLLGP